MRCEVCGAELMARKTDFTIQDSRVGHRRLKRGSRSSSARTVLSICSRTRCSRGSTRFWAASTEESKWRSSATLLEPMATCRRTTDWSGPAAPAPQGARSFAANRRGVPRPASWGGSLRCPSRYELPASLALPVPCGRLRGHRHGQPAHQAQPYEHPCRWHDVPPHRECASQAPASVRARSTSSLPRACEGRMWHV